MSLTATPKHAGCCAFKRDIQHDRPGGTALRQAKAFRISTENCRQGEQSRLSSHLVRSRRRTVLWSSSLPSSGKSRAWPRSVSRLPLRLGRQEARVLYAADGDAPSAAIPELDQRASADGAAGDVKPDGSSPDIEENVADAAASLEEATVKIMKKMLDEAIKFEEGMRARSNALEEEAQKLAERALQLREEADARARDADAAMARVEDVIAQEAAAGDAVIKAESALLLAQEAAKKAEEAVLKLMKAARLTTAADEEPGKTVEMVIEEVVAERAAQLKREGEGAAVTVNEAGGSGATGGAGRDPRTEPAEALGMGVEEKIGPDAEIQSGPQSWAVAPEAGLLDQAALKAELAVKESWERVAAQEEALTEARNTLVRVLLSKKQLQQEASQLSEVALAAKADAGKGEEVVAKAMELAEKAVSDEIAAGQRVADARVAFEKAEKLAREVKVAAEALASAGAPAAAEPVLPAGQEGLPAADAKTMPSAAASISTDEALEVIGDIVAPAKEVMQLAAAEAVAPAEVKEETEGVKLKSPASTPPSPLAPVTAASAPAKKVEAVPLAAEGQPMESLFAAVQSALKNRAVQFVLGAAVILGVVLFLRAHYVPSPAVISFFHGLQSWPQKVMELLPKSQPHSEETQLYDVLWLLLASVVAVPLFQKLPGGSPILGYLCGGALLGPHALSLVQHVKATQHIAEFGVVFLLFNIGLELSLERLQSMKKFVFGLGASQVLATAVVTGLFANLLFKQSGPAAIVIGGGLGLSSTAVALQVLSDRGEAQSRHGRASFSVLLFQDLAVVVLLILIPLLATKTSAGGLTLAVIGRALGVAAVKAVAAIAAIISGGRLILRPLYRRIAEGKNADIFSATTLLVVLATSVFTAQAGLSMALGAFLAGLLLAETEFVLQVESDIAPYRGMLLGLFFMTVGMSVDPSLLVRKFPTILGAITLLIVGKCAIVAAAGRVFGLSTIQAARAGLFLAPGGEFAFVAFGDAVTQGIMSKETSSLLFLVVGLSMAVTPYLAALGGLVASKFEQQDVRRLQPNEAEAEDLQGHILIAGFGRVGQMIAQLLSERLIPFVALDVRSERVAAGRALDLPVYFGDAGSQQVLHSVGAHRASAAVIALDTPGANYRSVWVLKKHFPNVKTFVRAHDVDHGINLEKAGATAVVPETLEPSLQLASAVLKEVHMPDSEIAAAIGDFRQRHLQDLTEMTKAGGTSLGYGYIQAMRESVVVLEGDMATKSKRPDGEGGNGSVDVALGVAAASG